MKNNLFPYQRFSLFYYIKKMANMEKEVDQHSMIEPMKYEHKFQSINDRVKDSRTLVHNYNKFPNKNEGQVTGSAIDISKVMNLVVIDIDINKKLSENERTSIRSEIIEKLPFERIGLVQTPHGGLHIYCDKDDYPLTKSSDIKVYSCEKYDIDLFAGIEGGKQRWVMQSNSKIREMNDGVRTTLNYNDLNNYLAKTNLLGVDDILNVLGIDLSFKSFEPHIETKEKPLKRDITDVKPVLISDNGIVKKITRSLAEKVVDGLTGMVIHNDYKHIDEEITLYTLFRAINSLIDVEGIDSEFIDNVYDNVKTENKLTDKAKKNFDYARKRYSHSKSHPFVLLKIVKRYNNEFYYNEVKVLLNENIITEINVHKINMKEEFSFTDIRKKCKAKVYKSDEEIISDLTKVMRFIDVKMTFVFKDYDSKVNMCVLNYKNKTAAFELLSSVIVREEDGKETTLTALFKRNNDLFVVKDVCFNSTNSNVITVFQGYKYSNAMDGNKSLIVFFLDFVKEVIAAGNEELYDYINKWIASIIQKPGIKTETALILKGLQGIGKNVFTKVICELLSGYSASNVTDISELTGSFNSIVESKMLIVLNEMKNCGDERGANFDALKSIITDPVIRINEKFQPRRTAENVANFIFCTNNSFPVKIESGDRRYVVTQVSAKYKDNLKYWEDFHNKLNKEFYENLISYYQNLDISEFNTRKIPETDAKDDIIFASMSSIDVFCVNHYENLIEGMLVKTAMNYKPNEYKSERTFQLALKSKCDLVKKSEKGRQTYYYKLKNECKEFYEKFVEEKQDDKDMDF